MTRTLAIVRFASEERIESFLDGEVYMNTLGYFSKLEDDSLRADEKEGDTLWLQNATLSIRPNGEDFIPINGLISPIRYASSSNQQVNVYCMFGVGEEVEREGIDPRVLNFGDTFAVITNPNLFCERLSEAAKQIGQEIRWGRIRYVDELEHDGAVGPYVKSARYSYQSEFRITMHPGHGCPSVLQIGDIRDIAITGRSEDLPTCMRFTHPSS